jgi:hypothetical protein
MAYTDSATVTGGLPIQGVWIHDPDSPEDTVRNFAFGANQRSHTYDPMGSGSYFAGRTFPVFDYGDPESEELDFIVDIPFGSTYAADLLFIQEFAKNRRPVWIRDNRGRATYGTIGTMKIQDQAWGSQATFTVSTSDRAITEATS